MFTFQKLRFILLLLALGLVACKDKEHEAPEKFYDELKAKRASKVYKVKAGDTLSSIAKVHGHTYHDIARWNNIAPPYRIIAGQELQLFKKPYAKEQVSPLNKTKSPLAPKAKKKISKPPKYTSPDKTKSPLHLKQKSPTITPKNTVQGFSFDDYIVKKGDTLYSIGRHFKVDHYLITAANNILSPSQLHVGKKLKIPNIKQKHSEIKIAKNQLTITKNLRVNPQKTSIISNNNRNMLKFHCQWPVAGKILKVFSKTGNKGVEISGQIGQKVKAAASGKVVAVNTSLYGHGKFIVIKHNKLYMTAYSNNRRTLVKLGQKVKQGQVIAEIGQIGYKPPILKFEIRKNGKSIDPIRFLPRR